MKNFEYYQTSKVAYFSKEDQNRYKAELKAVIDNAPMTRAEYDSAIAKLDQDIKKMADEKRRQYREEAEKLRQEFFEDARKDLGYASILDGVGVTELERVAWEEGHSNGFGEIFSKLEDLVDFCKIIIDSANAKDRR